MRRRRAGSGASGDFGQPEPWPDRGAAARDGFPMPTSPTGSNGRRQSSRIATARIQPAEAPAIFTAKHDSVNPVAGSASRLVSFSI